MSMFEPSALEFAEFLTNGGLAKTQLCEEKRARLFAECQRLNGPNFSPRIYALKHAGDSIGAPNTPREFLAKVNCYIHAGATCRNGVIEWLPKYLESQNYYLSNLGMQGKLNPHRNATAHEAYYWGCLGKAFTGEYRLEEALSACLKRDSFGVAYACPEETAKIYIRLGELDTALSLLRNTRKKTASRKMPEDEKEGYLQILDALIEDTEKKKARGYKYKPRPDNGL